MLLALLLGTITIKLAAVAQCNFRFQLPNLNVGVANEASTALKIVICD